MSLLNAAETRQLDRLALAVSSSAAAGGPRHARARGYGLEFEDYRQYRGGDDPRFIDWTVDARLRQLVVRVFRAEGQIRLHLAVDVSRSMTIGTPSKLACATKLAAALSYVAVARRDAVGLATFDDRLRSRVRASTGKAQLFKVLDHMARIEPGGRSSLDKALIDYATATRGPGLVIVLSDFLGMNPALDGLRYLLYRGLTPALVQILAPDDLDPDFDDDVEINDVENPSAIPFVVDAAAVRTYRERMARLSTDLREFSADNGLPSLQLASTARFDDVLAECLKSGLLATHA